MKLLISSDLHVDFSHKQKLVWNKIKYDLAIIAGDIANTTNEVEKFMKSLSNEIPLLWIHGNHDVWDYDWKKFLNKPFKDVKRNTIQQSLNVYNTIPGFLNRQIKIINNQRFLGCCLWYNIPGPPRDWSDYKNIIDWWMIEKESKEDVKFLEENLQSNDIVITHMLPTEEAISSQFIGDPCNKYFYNNVSYLIKERKPKLWICGHSHQRMIHKIYDTWLIRNPRGYPSENGKIQYTHVIVDLERLSEYDAFWDSEIHETYV